MSDVPGIYDVIGTGLSSGLSAATQFDPFNVTLTDPAPTTRYRTVAGAIDDVAAGKYQCQSGGAGCLTVNSIVVDVFMSNGVAGVSGASIATKTFGPVTNPGTGLQDWSVTFPFRTSPGAGQFAIPANGRYDVRAVFNGCSTATNPCTGTVRTQTVTNDNSFGVDNLAPTFDHVAHASSAYGPGGNLTVSGTASDAHSGLASPAVTVPRNADWLSHRD